MSADGCITKNKRNVYVTLQYRDKHHLEKLKAEVGYSGPITFKQNITRKGLICNYAALRINGVPQWCEDLELHFNIVPRKCHLLEPPNLTDKTLIKAYISGIIDGDGCIRKQGKCLYISISGTPMLLSWIKKIFDKDYPSHTSRIANIHQVKETKTFVYTVGGKRAETILLDLYNLEVPKLQRKWDKILQI